MKHFTLYFDLLKGRYTLDIFARNIAILLKRHFWTMYFKTNQGKLSTKHKESWFVVR